MTQPQITVSIPGLLQERICDRLIFSGEGLTIEKPLSFPHKVFLDHKNIAAFRFGVKELRGIKFVFGRQYFIEIKDFNCQISRIKLNSFYGIKGKEYYRIWADLLQNLWDFFLDNQLNYYTELYNIQQLFELAGVTFHADGISWNKHNKLAWNQIAIKSYRNYFMVHHIDDPKQYKCCIFSLDWNAVVLQSLLKDIVREHQRVRRTMRKDL
jgi:hypothetical protein